ncbi:MAG TPA: hypothetical protein PKC23_11680 [Candidatus Desulfobacillus sp.]|nr:hypothetical protein [Candidatus Desulfobacillus sp.]
MNARVVLPLLLALLCGLPPAAWAQDAANPTDDKDDDLNAPVVGRVKSTTKEQRQQYREQKEAAYARMKRYGVNREDIDALGRLGLLTLSGRIDPYVDVFIDELFQPGEHLHAELDEYRLSVKLPEIPFRGRLVPYTNTRNPTSEMKRYLKMRKGSSRGPLKFLDVGWDLCPSGLFARLSEKCDTAGVSMYYHIISADQRQYYDTPEKLLEFKAEWMKERIPTKADIEQSAREDLIDNRMGNRIIEKPNLVTINGRIWVRDAMMISAGILVYKYNTFLKPDRRLHISFGMPRFLPEAYPDRDSYPEVVKRGYALMDEVIGSLRIVKDGDDGSPDPFVVERTELGPLPAREQRPVGG